MNRLTIRKISIIMVMAMVLSVSSGTLSFSQTTVSAEGTLQNIALLPTTVASAGNIYNPDTLNFPRDGVIADWNYWAGWMNAGVWYEYDLGVEFDIKKIELVTKQDPAAQAGHRQNWEIIGYKNVRDAGTVLGGQGSTPVDPMATWTLDLTGTNNYRYIRMRKTAGGAEDMVITELRVFADPSTAPSPSPSASPSPTPTVNPDWVNIATLSSTIASGGGTYKDSELNYPRDGLVDSNIWGGYLVTGSWYEYDLGKEYDVRSIEVIPRQDVNETTHHRQNWEIIGYKDPRGSGTVLGALGGTPIPVLTTWRLNLSGTNNYRYIRLHKTAASEEDMAMTEFRVFVEPSSLPSQSPMPDFYISESVIKSGGRVITAFNHLTSSSVIDAELTVNKITGTGTGRTLNMIAALYDGKNLIDLKCEEKTIGDDESVKRLTLSYTLPSLLDDSDYSLKLMAWDDYNTVKPLCEPVKIKQEPMTTILGNVENKLSNDKELTIGYFGGSITDGTGASNQEQTSWRALTTKWFRDQFPDCNIQGINAAIGGTGSDLGAFRLQDDLLVANPDLVFVEFAGNDGGTPDSTIKRSMEGIMRQIWTSNPKADIVLVYSISTPFVTIYNQGQVPASILSHQAVADYYNIPSVNAGKAVYDKMKAEGTTISSYTIDGIHPNDKGYAVYFSAISQFLLKNLSTCIPEGDKVLPAQFTSSPVIGDVDAASNAVQTDWTMQNFDFWGTDLPYLTCNQPNKELVYNFTGTAIGLYYLIAGDSGDYEWSIDGGPVSTASTWDSYALSFYRNHYKILADNLQNTQHTLRIRVLPTKQEQSTGTVLRIKGFLVAE